MRHEFSTASGVTNIPGLSLRTIWRVDADLTYDVDARHAREAAQRIRRFGGTGWIVLRTLQGAGRVYVGDQVLEATQNTLIVLDWPSLVRYHAKQKRWNFWWFEFVGAGQLHAPTNRVLPVSAHVRDYPDFEEAYRLLRSESEESRRLASAIFSMMLYRWLDAWHGEWAVTDKQKSIWHVIELMHGDIERNWTVSELAQEVQMSTRSFNEAFSRVVGVAPKQFATRMRLEMARELLQLGLYNVKEVADRFGYSSPYHFSNAFFRYMGIRPSEILAPRQTASNTRG